MLTGWEKEELIGRKKFVYEVRSLIVSIFVAASYSYAGYVRV